MFRVCPAPRIEHTTLDRLKQDVSLLADRQPDHAVLNVEVAKDLLGGMIVTVGSRMVDDSLKRKLERLKRTLSGSRAA